MRRSSVELKPLSVPTWRVKLAPKVQTLIWNLLAVLLSAAAAVFALLLLSQHAHGATTLDEEPGTIVFEAAFGVLAICWVVLIFLWFRWSRWERRRRRRGRIARMQHARGFRISGSAGTP